jgi:hypothetical protein
MTARRAARLFGGGFVLGFLGMEFARWLLKS